MTTPTNAPDPADIGIGSGIEDVDRLVAAVGEVVAASRLIDKADIEVRQLLARRGDGRDLFEFCRLRGAGQQRAGGHEEREGPKSH